MPPSIVIKMYLHITAVVMLYWLISISMVFLNKSLLSGHANLSAPFFISWYQCMISVVGCTFVYLFLFLLPDKFGKGLQLQLSLAKCWSIWQLSLVYVLMIASNNMFLTSVGVSFFYVGRSLATVFNVFLSYLILGQKTSLWAMSCCVIIIAGFILAADQEGVAGTVTMHDLVVGVLSSLFSALNAVYVTKKLPAVENSILLLTLCNNINASVLFIPLIFINQEIPSLLSAEAVLTWSFWVEMTVAGIFALAIGYVSGMQIKVTSPLTHNVSGIAKSATQTVMATHMNAESKSVLWWVSNGMVLFGSMAYAWIRTIEM